MFKRSAFSLAIAASLVASTFCAVHAETPAQKKENIHRCLLQIYLSQHRPEASDEYKALLAIRPTDAPMHFEYGNTLFRGGNYAGAATEYQAAIKNGARGEYEVGLGNALMRTKNYRGAVAAYRKAVELGGSGAANAGQLLQSAQQYVQQQEAYDAYKKQQKENE
ncbi:MAG TPA: tetratricopeptide repeat protein [Drouetiella sp.]